MGTQEVCLGCEEREDDRSTEMLGLSIIIGAWLSLFLSLFWLLVGIGIGYSLWGLV